MGASRGGHTETLALLLANKADANAADEVIGIIGSFEFHFTFDIVRRNLCDWGFKRWSHRDTRSASGQPS
jgi:hypothetical protein